MKKRTIKLITGLAALCIIAGCSGKTQQSTSSVNIAELSDVNGLTLPIASDNTEISFLVNTTQANLEDKFFLQKLKEITGITVKPIVVSDTNGAQKLQLLAASKQLPDISRNFLQPSDIDELAINGALVNISDNLDKMPNLKKLYKDTPENERVFSDYASKDGNLYLVPAYGIARDVNHLFMYRKDVFEAAGLTMPANPTWDEVAQLSAQVDGAQAGMKGICLRGQAGWGQVFAPLTTVVNTFGGTWFDEDWNAQVNAAPFVEATQFYVDLVQQHGEPDAANAGFTECLNALTQGGVAMWYDATSAAGSLEADDSPVKGKIGYAPAPVKETDSSGWLYSWAFAIQESSQKKDDAWEFVSWASSQGYEELVGQEIGWANVPAGKRASTYDNPDYQASAAAFYEATETAISSADPADPGVQPRPAPGIQFVAIPEFAGMATQVSQGVSAAIAGQTTVQEALDAGQPLAQDAADQNK